jgi:hypothetical protein
MGAASSRLEGKPVGRLVDGRLRRIPVADARQVLGGVGVQFGQQMGETKPWQLLDRRPVLLDGRLDPP